MLHALEIDYQNGQLMKNSATCGIRIALLLKESSQHLVPKFRQSLKVAHCQAIGNQAVQSFRLKMQRNVLEFTSASSGLWTISKCPRNRLGTKNHQKIDRKFAPIFGMTWNFNTSDGSGFKTRFNSVSFQICSSLFTICPLILIRIFFLLEA